MLSTATTRTNRPTALRACALCMVALAGGIPAAGSKTLTQGTISLVDGVAHTHAAVGSKPTPATNTPTTKGAAERRTMGTHRIKGTQAAPANFIDAFGIPMNAGRGKVAFEQTQTRPDQFSRQA